MSAQLRYHTLVNNIGRIYSSEEKERTQYLQKGLDEIVGAIRPTTSDDWKRVKTDSDRLLKIWNVKENTDAASSVVVDQIRDMLLELSSAAASSVSSSVVSYPALKQQTLQNHQIHPTLEVSEKIAHVQEPLFASFVKTVPSSAPVVESKAEEEEAEEEAEEEEEIRVVVLSVSESKEGKEADEEEEVEEDEEEEVEEEEEEEEEEEVEEEVVEPEEEEVEEEVVEPEEEAEEAEEAEEEGLEVEQITIRGRTYWLDVNTKKLYANLEGDDVGDEVGAMVNGKAVFLAK
jgi:flagellar biosynthesis GTPase FlhF